MHRQGREPWLLTTAATVEEVAPPRRKLGFGRRQGSPGERTRVLFIEHIVYTSPVKGALHVVPLGLAATC